MNVCNILNPYTALPRLFPGEFSLDGTNLVSIIQYAFQFQIQLWLKKRDRVRDKGSIRKRVRVRKKKG